MRLVLATNNPGKLAELQELLSPLTIEVLPQARFTSDSADETGLSFVENAILKARYAARVSALPAIADDSGLEVDALRGAPGIFSARYAGAHASDADNLQKLLVELRDVPAEERTARYRCAIVLLRWDLDPAPLVCQTSWEGRIVGSARGSGGFGYDPVFELPDRKQTVAELSSAEKNRLSHRGRALRGLLEMLKTADTALGSATVR
jgi:XTP/dITP diphosphohydrolase